MSENSPVSSRGPGQKSLLFILLPLMPIVLAIGVAMAVRHGMETSTTAPSTEKMPGVQVGALAPDFSLPDAHMKDGDEPVTLSLMSQKSPVLMVFILGYNCQRCTVHLGELDAMRDEFAKAGVKILAITPDSPSNLRDSIQTYGDFHFPFLSDVDSKVARAYGLRDDTDGPMHGLFLIDTHRRVAFAAVTDHPYDEMDKVMAAANKLQSEK